MSNISKRLQEIITDEHEVMGPMKIRDVENAQQKIVNTVRSLEESGEIVISRGDDADVII
jgi:flagellar motor switch protein FliG